MEDQSVVDAETRSRSQDQPQGTLQVLSELIASSEDRLIETVLDYAKARGYTSYTSTLAEAWRISIAGLSNTLLSAISTHRCAPELSPDDDPAEDPLASFGVMESRRHRARGISIQMFLGLMKYYRQAYIDLVTGSTFQERDREQIILFINRVFDRVEIGFCSEWCSHDKDEHTRQLQATNRDLTNEKNKYLTIFESIHEPAFLLDGNARIDNLNHAAALLLNGIDLPFSRYYGAKAEDQKMPWLTDRLETMTARGEKESTFDMQITARDGPRWYQVILKKMMDVSEKYSGTVVVFTDITKRKQMEEQLRLQSMTDELTGLYNRRGFLNAAEQQLEIAHQLKKRMAIVAIDMDGLKVINDTLGHQRGDAAIVDIASLLKGCFRDTDLIGRLGGDEFAVLITDDDDLNLERKLVARLNADLLAMNERNSEPYQLAISLGVVRCPQGVGLSLDELLAVADASMYENKRRKKACTGA